MSNFFFGGGGLQWQKYEAKREKKKRLESRADFYSLPVGTLEAKR